MDRLDVTTNLLPALTAVTVHDTPTTRAASDHLPVTVHLDLAAERTSGSDV